MPALAGTASYAAEPKTWSQTSVEDFSGGTREDVVVTDEAGGALQLRHPMVKVVDDHRDNTIPRFAGYDSQGNYVVVLLDRSEGVFVQRYGADAQTLGGPVRASEEGTFRGNRIPTVAASDEGFIVAWDDSRNGGSLDDVYAQLFDRDGVSIGGNLRVNDQPAMAQHDPVCFVDAQGLFWVVWNEGHAQRYAPTGERVGSNFELPIQQSDHCRTFSVSVGRNGQMVLAWGRSASGTSTDSEVYAQRFDATGSHLGETLKVDDDSGRCVQMLPGVDFDAEGGFLVTWWDQRLGDCVMGQYYDAGDRAIGENFIVALDAGYAARPEVRFSPGGMFQVSWDGLWATEPNVGINGWEYRPAFSGTYTSEVLDTGNPGTRFSSVGWTADLPEACSLCLRVRTGQTSSATSSSPWYGPQDESGCYSVSGLPTNPLHDGDRFIQYEALFSTQQAGETPSLYDVSIRYASRDTVGPAQPRDLAAVPGHAQVVLGWVPNEETDLLGYELYRGLQSGAYDSAWTKQVPLTRTTHADSSAEWGTTYFYALSAVDSSLNESPLSMEVLASPASMTLHVEASSSGAGDGSVSNPFARIQDAMDRSAYGDTIRVGPGTYEENITLNRGVTLLGAGPGTCKIIGQTIQATVTLGERSQVSGFAIESSLRTALLCIVDCCAESVTVSDNVITGGRFPVRCSDCVAVVSRNILSGSEAGVRCRDSWPLETSVRISNNIILDTWKGIEVRNEAGGVRDCEIYNNTIYVSQTLAYGIVASKAAGAQIVGNVIALTATRAQRGIDMRECEDYEVSYNTVWTEAGHEMSGEPGEGNLFADPLFVNPSKGDFRLRADSPCRDAGNPDPAWNDVDWTRNDMGAYGGPDPIRLGPGHPKVAVMVSPATGVPGDNATVTLDVDNMAGVEELCFELCFDPALLTPLAATTTALTAGGKLVADLGREGTAQLALTLPTPLEQGGGPVLAIEFAVSPVATAGEASPLRLKDMALADDVGLTVSIQSITHGAFVVVERGPSDGFVYVDQGYSGVEEGTWDRPFDTIGEAMAASSQGDTVVVAAGIYRERVRIEEGRFLKGSGPLVSKIWFEADSDMEDPLVTFDRVSEGGISGFEVRRRSEMLYDYEAIVNSQDSSPVIRSNHIVSEGHTMMGCTIQLSGESPSGGRPIVEGNLIEVIGAGMGIRCSDSAPLITGNRFLVGTPESEQWGLDRTGISCWSSDALIVGNLFGLCAEDEIGADVCYGVRCLRTSSPTVANNIFEMQAAPGAGVGLMTHPGSSPKIVNNLIHGLETGLLCWTSSSTFLAENNVIWGNKTGLNCREQGSTVESSYNLFWENESDYEGCAAGAGDFNADPLFVDPEVGDFALAENSPCVDAGDPDPAYNDPDGSRNDIGIFGGPYAPYGGDRFGQSVRLTLPDTSASPGDTLVVPVEVSDALGVAQAEMVISYPSASLRVFDVRTSETSRTFCVSSEQTAADEIRVTMSSPEGVTQGDGALLTLAIAVSDAAQLGSKADIVCTRVGLRDELAGEMRVSGKLAASVTITTPKSAVSEQETAKPDLFSLSQNYPNPFNPNTTICCTIPSASTTLCGEGLNVRLDIYDLLGQRVRTLADGTLEPGRHAVTWDGKDESGRCVASGVYLCRLSADPGGFEHTRRMVLLR